MSSTPITLVDSSSTSSTTAAPNGYAASAFPTQWATLDLGDDAIRVKLDVAVTSRTPMDAIHPEELVFGAVIETNSTGLDDVPWKEVGRMNVRSPHVAGNVERYLRARTTTNAKAIAFTISGRSYP